MNLSFTLNKEDTLAFTEQYLRGSESHQKLRARTQWILPLILMSLLLLMASRGPLQISTVIIFGGVSLAWFFLYPKQFDANIRKHAKKQMKESSYSKSYGEYNLGISDSGIQSSSPLGESSYSWDGVDRVEMSDDYLYIFLAGPMGYPIRIDQIGRDSASEAFETISEQLKNQKA